MKNAIIKVALIAAGFGLCYLDRDSRLWVAGAGMATLIFYLLEEMNKKLRAEMHLRFDRIEDMLRKSERLR